jgi:8-oxo-dGTP pyrophosphatase MutT (NUDIX family)
MSTIVEQAGAVTFRQVRGTFKILLIRSKKTPQRWVFPKGHIEAGENASQAAKRELFEEAGVTGTVLCEILKSNFVSNEKEHRVTYFVARYESSDGDGEFGREPTWFSYEEATVMITIPQMREVLDASVPLIKQYLI